MFNDNLAACKIQPQTNEKADLDAMVVAIHPCNSVVVLGILTTAFNHSGDSSARACSPCNTCGMLPVGQTSHHTMPALRRLRV